MAKQLLYGNKARQALREGVNQAANAVKITIGPRGRNVVLEKSYGAPLITNDGVTIVKEIDLSNKFEKLGAEMLKEVATKTNDVSGDGTTTAIVLAQALINKGLDHTNKGVNAMGIRLGIEAAATRVVEELRKMAKPIKNKAEIKQVATISAESVEIGTIIAETIDKVGKDGVVTAEESQSFGIESDVVEGMRFDKGYVSPYMITNGERMEAEFNDALILITDKRISSIKDILPLLEKVVATGKKELVIIADDIDGEALTTFVLNKLRGAFSVLGVKAPGYGDKKKDMLADIAVLCGGIVITEETGHKLDMADLSHLGRAKKIIATKEHTTIVGGKGKKAAIEERVTSLRAQVEQSDSKYAKEGIMERIGKLTGGVAVIRVGAATETEMKYLKLKVEDAVNATKAAIEEGIVPGGGTALIRAADAVRQNPPVPAVASFDKEFKVGVEIVLKALEAPLRQIAENAGADSTKVLADIRKVSGMAGYDALKDEVVPDMLVAGIIDPVKVTRSGVQNAASVAAILLTTEVAVVEEPKKEEKSAGGGMGGGMDY